MNTQNISVFRFQETHTVRVQVIDGNPWFCLRDVCDILDIKNTADLVAKQLDGAGIEKIYVSHESGKKATWFISEPNLYRVIFRSNKPEAKTFQDWVFNDVLPSIRKTGGYVSTSAQPQPHPEPNRCLTEAEVKNISSHVANVSRYLPHSGTGRKTSFIYNTLCDELGIDQIRSLTQNRVGEAIEHLLTLERECHQFFTEQCQRETEFMLNRRQLASQQAGQSLLSQ